MSGLTNYFTAKHESTVLDEVLDVVNVLVVSEPV
jgi:hypothetical protein